MSLVTIPNRPLGTDLNHIAALEADFDAITTAVNGGIDGANVVDAITGWRLIGHAHGWFQSAGTYCFLRGGSNENMGVDTFGRAPVWWHIDPSKYSVPGKTTQMVMRAALASSSSVGGSPTAQVLRGASIIGGTGAIGLSQSGAVAACPAVGGTLHPAGQVYESIFTQPLVAGTYNPVIILPTALSQQIMIASVSVFVYNTS